MSSLRSGLQKRRGRTGCERRIWEGDSMREKNSSDTLTRVVFSAVMAAIVCVVTIFRIPLG